MKLTVKQKLIIDKLITIIKVFKTKHRRKQIFLNEQIILIPGEYHSYICLRINNSFINSIESSWFYDMVVLDKDPRPKFHRRLHPRSTGSNYKIQKIAASEFLREFMYLTNIWDETQLNLKLDQYMVDMI